MTSAWVERGGIPWFPITGEIHYSRIPRDRWRDVLGHARAGGLTSVATYVFWQAHEPEPGQFRWDGQLDLRAFIEEAATHGLDVVVRLGPWAHGEARYGGFPDWLVERKLAHPHQRPRVPRAGARLLRRDDRAAPWACRTPTAGRSSAPRSTTSSTTSRSTWHACASSPRSSGSASRSGRRRAGAARRSPIRCCPCTARTRTASGTTSRPSGPSSPRSTSATAPSATTCPSGPTCARRSTGSPSTRRAVPLKDDDAVPFATCELGGGMHVAYHRRPIVAPADVAALALAKVGSGSIWQGYYMYAGGTQRTGAARLRAGVARDRLPQRRATGDLRLRRPDRRARSDPPPPPLPAGPAPVAPAGRAPHRDDGHDGRRRQRRPGDPAVGRAVRRSQRLPVRLDVPAREGGPAGAARRAVHGDPRRRGRHGARPSRSRSRPVSRWCGRSGTRSLRASSCGVRPHGCSLASPSTTERSSCWAPTTASPSSSCSTGTTRSAERVSPSTATARRSSRSRHRPARRASSSSRDARIIVLDQESIDRLYLLEVDGRERLVLSSAPLYARGRRARRADGEPRRHRLAPPRSRGPPGRGRRAERAVRRRPLADVAGERAARGPSHPPLRAPPRSDVLPLRSAAVP